MTGPKEWNLVSIVAIRRSSFGLTKPLQQQGTEGYADFTEEGKVLKQYFDNRLSKARMIEIKKMCIVYAHILSYRRGCIRFTHLKIKQEPTDGA